MLSPFCFVTSLSEQNCYMHVNHLKVFLLLLKASHHFLFSVKKIVIPKKLQKHYGNSRKNINRRGPGTCFFNQPQTPMGRIIKESYIPKGIWWRGESNCEKVITIKSGGSLCANRYCFSQIKTMTTGNPRILFVPVCGLWRDRGVPVYNSVHKCLFMLQQSYAADATSFFEVVIERLRGFYTNVTMDFTGIFPNKIIQILEHVAVQENATAKHLFSAYVT